MDLYEYQGKELLRRSGIPVSEGRLATTPAEARAAAEELGGKVVVKAQVLTGGRGKAGGIKLADDPEHAERKAAEILGLDIRGHVVRKLWIERASDIESEHYLSVTLDRGEKKALLMYTAEGGVDIEQVAAESPEAILRAHIHPLEGYERHLGNALVGTEPRFLPIVELLYRCFGEYDAMLCEINPLIITTDGEVRALDAKVTIDDSALYRQPEIAEWRDTSAADPLEALAREKGVAYVKLDGTVGVVCNGAGLAMSTVDLVVVAGGKAANFCDLGGGGSSSENAVNALEVIASDTQARSILFNVFGGIVRCDDIARGILAAIEQVGITIPMVVRLDGRNAEEGREILASAGLPNVHVEPTMLDAAKRAVELAA